MNRWMLAAICGALVVAAAVFQLIEATKLNPWVVLFVKLPVMIVSPLALIGFLYFLLSDSKKRES